MPANVTVSAKLSTGQAATLLGVSAQRVQQLVGSGVLKAERTPLGYLFNASDVARLKARRDKR